MKSKRIFFFIAFSAGFLYGAFFGFTGNLNDHMVKRFGFEPKTAGLIIPIIYVCPSIITPIFGKYTDSKGQRVKMIILATIIFLASHLYIAYLPDVPDVPDGTVQRQVNYDIIFGLIGIGVFYSIYAAVIWPCIALVVDEKLTGIAYGFTASIQSLILTFLPLVLGDINVLTKGEKHGYFWSQICLAGIVVAGLMLTIIVYFEDKLKNGARLDRPGTDRESTENDEKPERTESTL
jgi:MFS family permease